MNLLENLPLPQIDQVQEIFPLKFDNLYKESTIEFFRKLDPFVNELLSQHSAFKLWYDVLGPEKREIIRSAVIDQDFSRIKDDSEDYQTALHLLIFKNKLRHSIIKKYLDTTFEHIDLKPFEVSLLRHYCDLAETTDRIFLQWRTNLFHTELGRLIKTLEEHEDGKGAKYVKELGLNNQYSVYREEDGRWKQFALAAAFPEEYREQDITLGKAIEDLNKWKTDSEVPAILNYLQAMKDAFACVELEKLDALWEAVDVAWLQIRGRLQPVHAMEFNYIDPARIRVMPENRLMLADLEYDHVNQDAKQTQESLINDLKKMFQTKQSWPDSEKAMRQSHIGVYIPCVSSGANLAFKFVGQSAPCREHIRIKYGSKISLNMQSCKDRFAKEMKYTAAVFGQDIIDTVFSAISAEENISLRIAGHEVAHASFVNENTTSRIGFGIVPLLEEAKATWGEYATIHERVNRGELPSAAITKLVLLLVSSNMRYLTIKHETTLQPYYNGALMELSMMFEAGLIRKQNEKFILDLSKIDEFYRIIKGCYNTMVEIYDSYNTELAKKLLAERAKETPLIMELYEIVSKVK